MVISFFQKLFKIQAKIGQEHQMAIICKSLERRGSKDEMSSRTTVCGWRVKHKKVLSKLEVTEEAWLGWAGLSWWAGLGWETEEC